MFYEVRSDVLMSAEFDKDGQICVASFQPTRISKSKNTDYVGKDTLNIETLKEIFNELVPIETREGKFESMGFMMTGSMGFSAVLWENVRFNVKYNIGRKPNLLLNTNQKDKEGINSLFTVTNTEPDLAFISWTKRTCVE